MPKKNKALKFTQPPVKSNALARGAGFIPGKGYAELVKNLNAEFSALEGFIRSRTVEGFKNAGRYIHEHILKNKDRADYGQHVFKELEKDTGKDESSLRKILKFYRAYPISVPARKLSWTHYDRLSSVSDPKERKALEQKVIKEGWNTKDLRVYFSRKKAKEAFAVSKFGPIPQLSVTRSRLYTYQILEPSYVHAQEGEMIVDLGFSNNTQVEAPGIKLGAGELIESIKTGSSYKLNHSDAKPKELYTYVALVERVVDADTFWLNIDCGFKFWTRKKVRLRGIDCPELSTKEGQEAKKFVEARLKEVSFIVVKTYKEEKYGRYLTDVFYLKDEPNPRVVLEKGTFLNQELLDLGFARIWD